MLGLALIAAVVSASSFADGPISDPNLALAVKQELKLDAQAELKDEHLKNLFILEAVGRDIADLTGLEKCPNLSLVRLSRNKVARLDPLKDLKNLQSLDVSGNAIVDLGPISGLVKLQYLVVSDNQVERLDAVSGLVGLSSLDASGNKIAELGPVGGLKKLASLYLGRNAIRELGPIAGLTGLSALNLSDNPVVDAAPLAGLAGLRLLVLERCQVADLGPIVGAAKADAEGPRRFAPYLRLYLKGNPLSEAAKNDQVPALKAAGVRVELGP